MPSPARDPSPRSRRALYLLALALGLYFRLEGLTSTPLFGDEYHSARLASLPFAELLHTYDSFGTHVPLPLLQRLCAQLLGPTLLALRLPALASGLLALLLIYPTARTLIGRPGALVATWALALSPLHIHYSRFARAYALEMFLALALLWAVPRLRSSGWKSTPLAALVVALLGLLPWVHLASAGLVAGVALAAMALGWADAGRPRGAMRPLLLAVLGAALCMLLFVPLRAELVAYLGKYSAETQDRPSGVTGILTLLAGGRQAAWVLGLGVPLAIAWLARERPASATLLGAATLGPVVVLACLMPHGMEYAYARYLAAGVPLALMLVAWLVVRSGGDRWGVLAGIVLVAAGHFAGPRGPARVEDHPFDNTPLALADLPAFDRPFPRAPELYSRLAADASVTGIVEVPALTSRTVLLYRNYRLVHGKHVVLGLSAPAGDQLEERFERFAPVHPGGPYVRLSDLDTLASLPDGPQVLILHKDVLGEVSTYWTWVFRRAWPELHRTSDEGLMRRLGLVFFPETYLEAQAAAAVQRLEQELGPPFFEDEQLLAWRLR